MEVEDKALSECDREPIHQPGAIQPFGSLVAFGLDDWRLRHFSENLRQLLPGSSLDGDTSVRDLFGTELAHAVRGACAMPTIRHQPERLGRFEIGTAQLDASVHCVDDQCVVELEPGTEMALRGSSAVSSVRSMLASLPQRPGIEGHLEGAVQSLRSLTGFDRVMAYRFLPGGDGEVVAEAKGPAIEPYLGLRYPAWDIPRQVRAVAVRMPFRIIADIAAPPVPLHATRAGDGPLDLTYCHLRAVSPIHVEYLTNMGVRATMNVSILVRGELWGLYAFHHYAPRRLSLDQRTLCELFGDFSSLHIQQRLEEELLSRRKRTDSARHALLQSSLEELVARFPQVAAALAGSLPMDGVALVSGATLQKYGDVPADSVVLRIAALAHEDNTPIESLAAAGTFRTEELGKTGGALVLTFAEKKLSVLFFRNETIYEVRWSGSPAKNIRSGPHGPRLHPRASFEEYRESVRGRCNPWSAADLAAAADLRATFQDVMAKEGSAPLDNWQKQVRQRDLVIAELNHRVKNVLALVRSLVRQTSDTSVSLEAFTQSLEERIRALAATHELVGGTSLHWVDLGNLVNAEFRPYRQETQDRVTCQGPDVRLRPDIAPVVGLVVHELASNAAKHGALSQAGGSVAVRWHEEAGGLAVDWREHGGPPVVAPSRHGFGRSLVERALPYECGGEATLDFAPDGLRVRLWLPAAVLQVTPVTAQPREAATTPTVETAGEMTLERVLVVEDSLILALEMGSILRRLGCLHVDSARSAAEARTLLARHAYTAALLDVHLADGDSFALAEELHTGGVPLLFVSGSEPGFEQPESLRSVPHLTKPIDENRLKRELHYLARVAHEKRSAPRG